MQTKLISMTSNPIEVMWVAARTCYSEKSPIELWEDRMGQSIEELLDMSEKDMRNYTNTVKDKHWNLVKKVLDSGHQSVAEHVYFTFAIEGISRACSHQLVRHRAGIVFSQQSQRYVEIKEDFRTLYDLLNPPLVKHSAAKKDVMAICSKYFVDVNDDNYYSYANCLLEYIRRVNNGQKAEDARQILPNATKTNITMSLNFRELIHICNLRLCSRAQAEIRQVFKLIKEEVLRVDERLASLLVPSCEAHGVCTEHKCCGRKPRLDEVKKAYKLLEEDDTILSKEDWEQLVQSINSPAEVNKKLKELLEMKSVLDN